jgi:hypothetical protein
MSHEEEGRPESGVSRRTLIKRGAIVGGLVWVTPVVQSLTTPANAQEVPGGGSPLCRACLAVTVGSTTTHFNVIPSSACCNCIEANGGNLAALFICLASRTCTLGPEEPGPCP